MLSNVHGHSNVQTMRPCASKEASGGLITVGEPMNGRNVLKTALSFEPLGVPEAMPIAALPNRAGKVTAGAIHPDHENNEADEQE